MKSEGREREKKIEWNVSPGAMLPRNFNVSVMRFLNWGLSWSFKNVRPKMLFPMSG